MTKTRLLPAVSALAACLITTTAAFAQSFPNKPLRFLVPTGGGGIIDVAARLIGKALEAELGQPVLVDNRPGATYQLATDLCAHAPPDGHTFCSINISTHSFNPYVFKKLPYDPIKDFKPVYFQLAAVQGFSASPKLAANTVAELKEYAIKNKGQLNFATLGPGSSADLFRQWLNKEWGTDIAGVAYGGGSQIQVALMSGEVQLTIVGVGTLTDNIRQGNAKLLSVSSKERIKEFPNAPTFQETGLGAYPSSFWLGIAVPAATPDAIVKRLNEAFNVAAKDPKYQEYMNNNALQFGPTTIDGFKEYMEKDRLAAETIFKLIGLQPK
jgi:tripartite-type tricarboxylate transporter receptor subunit TctC